MFCHLYWFVAATEGKFLYFEIQIFMLLKLESESETTLKKYAIESGIRIRRFFGRIAIPDQKPGSFIFLFLIYFVFIHILSKLRVKRGIVVFDPPIWGILLNKPLNCRKTNIQIKKKNKINRYSPVLCSWSTNTSPLILDLFLILAPAGP